jgi:hypothetical protein
MVVARPWASDGKNSWIHSATLALLGISKTTVDEILKGEEAAAEAPPSES